MLHSCIISFVALQQSILSKCSKKYWYFWLFSFFFLNVSADRLTIYHSFFVLLFLLSKQFLVPSFHTRLITLRAQIPPACHWDTPSTINQSLFSCTGKSICSQNVLCFLRNKKKNTCGKIFYSLKVYFMTIMQQCSLFSFFFKQIFPDWKT